MLKVAAMVTASCVLFIQMGLCDAIQEILQVKFSIISCPKCLTMWTTLTVLLVNGFGFLEAIAVSFISAYAALWLCILYDGLAVWYNKLYERIIQATSSAQNAADEDPEHTTGGADAVPKM